jgi:hypothetical protein
MKSTQFLSREEWTERAVKSQVEKWGWYAWRRVDGGWMIFQMESDFRTWKAQA